MSDEIILCKDCKHWGKSNPCQGTDRSATCFALWREIKDYGNKDIDADNNNYLFVETGQNYSCCKAEKKED